MKYNAAMTSNAAVKRLFLLEKDHLKLKRFGLSDHWGIQGKSNKALASVPPL